MTVTESKFQKRIVKLSRAGVCIGQIADELGVSRSTVKKWRSRAGFFGTPGPKMEPLDWAKCGTEANYAAHRRRGETPCSACRAAGRIARTERKRRRAA